MTCKPDFLCIGMQKAGTRFLYDLMVAHPAFWMPMVKEFHHFDDVLLNISERQETRLARNIRAAKRYTSASEARLERINVRRIRAGKRSVDETDLLFWQRYLDYLVH